MNASSLNDSFPDRRTGSVHPSRPALPFSRGKGLLSDFHSVLQWSTFLVVLLISGTAFAQTSSERAAVQAQRGRALLPRRIADLAVDLLFRQIGFQIDEKLRAPRRQGLPQRFSSTASSMFIRRRSKPVALRCGVP